VVASAMVAVALVRKGFEDFMPVILRRFVELVGYRLIERYLS
jgi:hypothetical protein